LAKFTKNKKDKKGHRNDVLSHPPLQYYLTYIIKEKQSF